MINNPEDGWEEIPLETGGEDMGGMETVDWSPGNERALLINHLKKRQAELKGPEYFDKIDRAGSSADRANLFEAISKASSKIGAIGGQEAGSSLGGMGERADRAADRRMNMADAQREKQKGDIAKVYAQLADLGSREKRADVISAGMQGKLDYAKTKDQLEAQRRQQEAKAKLDFDRAESDKKLALEREKIKADQNKTTNKEPTQTQFMAAGYARRLEQAEQKLLEVDKNPGKVTGVRGYIQDMAPNFAKNSNQQEFEQAKRNFVNAVLRKESGAAISPTEFESAEKQYFPKPGDSANVIAQKSANRKQKLAELKGEAGPAYERVPLIPIGSPAQQGNSGEAIASPGKKVIKTQVNPKFPGKTKYFYDDGSSEVR